jgi:predicted phage terminase large subunit-like protein
VPLHLAGGHAEKGRPARGKATQATPFASQVHADNVLLLRGPWNDACLAECTTFPGRAYDDQEDAAARGFNGLLQPSAGIFP